MNHLLLTLIIVLLSSHRAVSSILPLTDSTVEKRQYVPTQGDLFVIALTNENIQEAVALWLDDQNNNRTLVETTYGGPIGQWDLSGVTSLEEVFADVQRTEAESVIDLSGWDVSRVTSMRALFFNTANLAVHVASWDTSQVRDMRVMLAYSTNFKGDISNWNTDSLEILRAAFTEYSAGESSSSTEDDTLPISNWKTPQLTDMEGTFAGTNYFQTDLSGWSTSKVTNMAFLFENTTNFYGGDLSLLDTSNVLDMENMFAGAVNVRGARDIAKRWDTRRVENMYRIFYNTTVTMDEGTAPADTDLFYLCWNLESLENTTLDEAFCHSNAGGFNCDCVREDLVKRINTGCNDTRMTCFNSMGTAGQADEDPGVESAVDLTTPTSGAASLLQHLFAPAVILALSAYLLRWE